MRLSTHLLTGACAGAMVAAAAHTSITNLAFMTSLATLINYLIDLGHIEGRYGPRRSSFTHSVVGIAVISVVLAVAMQFLSMYLGIRIVTPTYLILASLVAGGLTHLMLDSLTEGGVYLLWPFKRRRYALAHIDYDNPVANALATLAFILPTLYLMYHFYGGEVVKWLVRLESFR